MIVLYRGEGTIDAKGKCDSYGYVYMNRWEQKFDHKRGAIDEK
jgi:hypothetical protein